MAVWIAVLCLSLSVLTQAHIQVADVDASLHFTTDKEVNSVHGLETDFWKYPSSTYYLMGWAKQDVMPEEEVTLMAVESGYYQDRVSISKKANGEIVGRLVLIDGNVVAKSMPSPAKAGVWEHVALMTCEDLNLGWTVKLCTTPWRGVPKCKSFDLERAPARMDVGWASAYLGGENSNLMKGQVLDVRVDIYSCLAESRLQDIVTHKDCSSQCTKGCKGPGNNSCTDFVLIRDVYPSTVLKNNGQIWMKGDPYLQSLQVSSRNLAATGWFYRYPRAGSNSLFHVGNGLCADGSNCRTFWIEVSEGSQVALTMNTNKNSKKIKRVHPNFKVEDQWVFIAGSQCYDDDKKAYLCVGLWGEKDLECETMTYDDDEKPSYWNSQSTGNLSFGGTPFNTGSKYSGEIADGRFYNRCLKPKEMKDLFKAKEAHCEPGCGECGSPDTCLSCSAGYFSEKVDNHP